MYLYQNHIITIHEQRFFKEIELEDYDILLMFVNYVFRVTNNAKKFFKKN